MDMQTLFPPFDPGRSDSDRVPARRRVPFRHILPNLVTILAICAGMTGVRFAFEGRFEFAVALVLGAAALDGIDGRLARFLKGQSRFGAEMDSLADIVNFGVAPGLVLYAYMLDAAGAIGWIAALLYASACALRLARFNIMLDDPDRPKWQAAFFTGVPAPAGAGLAMLPLYVSFVGIDFGYPKVTAVIAAVYIVLVGLLMASRLPTWSGKGAGLRVRRDLAIPLILCVVFYVALLLSFFWATLTATTLAYIVSIGFSVRAFQYRAARERLRRSGVRTAASPTGDTAAPSAENDAAS